jgi:hypothetical protein
MDFNIARSAPIFNKKIDVPRFAPILGETRRQSTDRVTPVGRRFQ